MKELLKGLWKSKVLLILSVSMISAGFIDLLLFTLSGGLLFASFIILCLSLIVISLNLTIKKILIDETVYNKMKNTFKL